MECKKTNSHFGTGMVIGAIMAVAGGLFLQSKKGKEMTEDARQKALELQKQVMDKLEDVEEVTKEKYAEVVDHVMAYYDRTQEIAKTELPEIRDYLMNHWKTVEGYMKAPVGKETTPVKAKKAAK